MSNGFNSKVNISEDLDNKQGIIKDTNKDNVREISAISKESFEHVVSNKGYNSMTLDEQLSDQLQEMHIENERLEKLRQGEDIKEKEDVKENKNENTQDKHSKENTSELER